MIAAKNRFPLRKLDERRYELDVRGYVCPYPQLLAMRALNTLSQDDILEIVLDNPPSVRDIPPALEEKGYKVEIYRIESSTWKLVVRSKKET